MNWDVEFARLFKKNDGDQGIVLATVVSVDPFVIHTHDIDVKKYIYKNPDEVLKYGDQVIAFRKGVSFFILGKVVKVA